MYNKLVEAAHKFLRKCDTGRARSVETYAELTVALEDPRVKAYKAIDTERNYQEKVWGPNRFHTVGDYVTMLQHYQHKLVEAWTVNAGDDAALDVIRKIAGICVACFEEHGVVIREQKPHPLYDPIDQYGPWVIGYIHPEDGKAVFLETYEEKKEGESIRVQTSLTRERKEGKEWVLIADARKVAEKLQSIEDAICATSKRPSVTFLVVRKAGILKKGDTFE